ncbi:aldo/keto reductase [Oceanibium sediminis]|uniref:aldo/keto reductase n=1 Tax=Oceanibium sediminis TaxID=2026339 RepID=UPI000DD4B2CF|nr:aldo/keto reductase [Oceanibium sediminis]
MQTQDLAKKLGKSVSPLAFGVMQFGGKADETAAHKMYDMAREAGITLFDAAWLYTEGRAERMLGEFAAPERDDLVLISKCGYAPGLSGAELKQQVHESLERLGTDHLDILYLHRYPGDDRLDEALSAMAELHREGAFRLLGVSNFAAWQVMKAQARAAALGAPRIEVIQPMYNLVKRQAEVEILPMAISEGLTVHSYSPLGGGLLTGKYSAGGAGRLTENDHYQARYGPVWMHAAATALNALAIERGLGAPALAIAWAAAHPAVSAPIISASHPDQMEASLAALEMDMTPALYAELSALTPAPPPATDRLEETLD